MICLFHEIAHVKLHLSVSEYAFFDDLDLGTPSGSKETQADDWAQEMLIPSESVDRKCRIYKTICPTL